MKKILLSIMLIAIISLCKAQMYEVTKGIGDFIEVYDYTNAEFKTYTFDGMFLQDFSDPLEKGAAPIILLNFNNYGNTDTYRTEGFGGYYGTKLLEDYMAGFDREEVGTEWWKRYSSGGNWIWKDTDSYGSDIIIKQE